MGDELLIEVVKIQEGIKHLVKDFEKSEINQDKMQQNIDVIEKKVDAMDAKLEVHSAKCPLNKKEIERVAMNALETTRESNLKLYTKVAILITAAIGAIEGIKVLWE